MDSQRYERNIGTISLEENEKLRQFRVCVVGCGGLGGHVIEGLARIGIGNIFAVDGDVFQASNLNRQLLSTERNLGRYKALAAQERIHQVNSDVKVHPLCYYLTEENGLDLIKNYDVVIDALDNISSRRILEYCCKQGNMPLVHGAIAGWHGQVSVIMPGDDFFQTLYPDGEDRGIETETGNPSFTPALVAAIEVAEALKILLGRKGILRNKLLTIDLLNQEYETIEL